MKTTAGKTKPVPPGERLIRIYSVTGKRIIAQFNAKSLRLALKQYYESRNSWQDKGWTANYKGNTLQVSKGKSVRLYRALEITQQP